MHAKALVKLSRVDVVGYFKAGSALAKWKLRPAKCENDFMSVDGRFCQTSQTSHWEVAA